MISPGIDIDARRPSSISSCGAIFCGNATDQVSDARSAFAVTP